jgi:hypothetical protein
MIGVSNEDIDILRKSEQASRAAFPGFVLQGDHTDIKSLMSNFDDYKRNFMRIQFIQRDLNLFKSSYDRDMVRLFNLAKQGETIDPKTNLPIMKAVENLKTDFANKTGGYDLGDFSMDKQGNLKINPRTPVISDLDAPINQTLKQTALNLQTYSAPGGEGELLKNKFDQEYLAAETTDERTAVLEKYKDSKVTKGSRILQGLSNVPGPVGRATKTFLAGGAIVSPFVITSIASADTPTQEMPIQETPTQVIPKQEEPVQVTPKQETKEDLPYEAALPASVLFGKYAPTVAKTTLNVGKGIVRPIIAPIGGAGFAISELLSEDPSFAMAGAEMLYPEIIRQATDKGVDAAKGITGVKRFADKFKVGYNKLLALAPNLKYAPTVSKGMSLLGTTMIGADIAQGLGKRIGPSQRGPLTEQELLDMRGKETYMGNIADTFDKAYQTRSNFRGGDAARSDAASGRDAGRASPSGGVNDRGSDAQNLNQQGIVAAAKIRNAQPQKSPFQTFLDHSLFTKGLKRVGSIPNYHQLGGFDFMSRFPNTPSSVAKGLGYAYQGLTEFGKSLTDPDYSLEEAYDRAKEEGRLNAAGIDDFFNPNSLTAQQYFNLPSDLQPNFAIGGRVGFAEGPEDPSKRKFMKIMGGLASLPIVGRFFDVAQVAEKAAPAVVETFKNAPSHFVGLVNKIRALGKIVDPKKMGVSEDRFSNVYEYGDYKMFEGKDGQIEIAKDKLMATDYGDAKVSEEYMSYNPKSPKYNKKGELTGETEPQYDEYTAYADQDGKMKDVVDGVDPNTIDDGTYSKEELEQLIIEQVEQNLKKGKK